MIEGFLESVTATEARGWACDTDRPAERLKILIYNDSRLLGETTADIYRRDLSTSNLGDGEHAFLLRFEEPIQASEIGTVVAETSLGDPVPVRLKRLYAQPASHSQTKDFTPLQWHGQSVDEEATPLFILGSARSGTSAITHAILEATSYIGNEEGHVFDLLASFSVRLEAFYVSKADECTNDHDTTIRRLPKTFFSEALDSMLITTAQKLFGTEPWLDKTPTSDMVHLAPRFLQIWPRAKFIFMRRRAIDNIMSRQRKFDHDFERNCREWANAMDAWDNVRTRIQNSSIELDQVELATKPYVAAHAIADLLALTEVDERRLSKSLELERPQLTGDRPATYTKLASTGWDKQQIAIFRKICGPMFDRFGYVED